MDLKSQLSVAICLMVSFGCQVGVQVVEPPPRPVLKPVKVKPTPGVLKALCVNNVDQSACDRVKEIRSGVKALQALHKQHRSALIKRLSSISKLLRAKETFPISAVDIEKVVTSKWNSLNETYPISVRLRMQYLEGKKRHPKSSELMNEMKSLVEAVRAQTSAWRDLERKFEGPLDLGVVIAKERQMVSLNMLVGSARFTEKAFVPKDLLRRFFGDLTETQHLDLSIVYDNGGKKRQYIAQEWLWVVPAFFTTGSDGAWFITESSAKLESRLFQVGVDVNRYCENLRAEIRYLERGKRPKISWMSRRKAQK